MRVYHQRRKNSAALAALMDSLALDAPVARPPAPEPTPPAPDAVARQPRPQRDRKLARQAYFKQLYLAQKALKAAAAHLAVSTPLDSSPS